MCSVPTIDASGLATTLKAGTTTLTATKDGQTRSVDLVVGAAILESISVFAPNGSILKGQTQQYAATGHLTDGTTQDLSTSVTWSSDAPNVAISNAPGTEGLAVALDVGLATITATGSGGLSGTAKLDVTADALTAITVSPATATRPKGLTQQFTATATYAGGGTKDVTAQVDWSATAPYATVSAAGLATGPAKGGSPFDEAIERTWVQQWLFYANSTRFAAAMAGADYGTFANGRWQLAAGLRQMVDWLSVRSK